MKIERFAAALGLVTLLGCQRPPAPEYFPKGSSTGIIGRTVNLPLDVGDREGGIGDVIDVPDYDNLGRVIRECGLGGDYRFLITHDGEVYRVQTGTWDCLYKAEQRGLPR